MAFAQARDTVCPGQKLTLLEGPLKADIWSDTDVG